MAFELLVIQGSSFANDGVIATEEYIPIADLIDGAGVELFLIDFENPVKNFDPTKSVRRRSLPCLLAVSFLSPGVDYDNFFENFTTSLMTSLDPFSKKDEDFFIFTCADTSDETLLLHPKAMEIKYKILVTPREVKTACFYCKDGGLPQLVSIEHETLADTLGQDKLFPDFTLNGNGHTLRASSQTKLLFLMEIKQVGRSWRFKRGSYWSMLEVLLDKFNFTYVTFPAHGGGGSGTLKNGVWYGAVRDIIDGRADISMATTTDYSRFQVVGGSKPISFIWVNFILGEPQATYSWKAILWPLDSSVWVAIGIVNILLIIAFKVLERVELKIRNEEVSDVTKHEPFNQRLEQSMFAVMLEQEVLLPSKPISQIMFLSWMFVSLVLVTGYRSKLVGLMTFPTLDTQPQTYSELAESDYSWGLESSTIGSSGHNFFLISPDPLYQRIYHLMEFEYDTKRCFMRAVHNKYACLAFNEQAEYMIYRNFSSKGRTLPVKLSKDYVGYSMPAIAMRKRSIYRTNFDRVIETTREMGVVEKWRWMDYAQERRKHFRWKRKNKIQDDSIPESDDEGAQPLELKQLTGPFGVLFSGSMIGTAFFMTEVFRNRISKTLCHRVSKAVVLLK
ncbi:unnamed protein product [Allacma fusca]|uniref:Ionotropic glutamate receptor C-terminal domain-containing protein n=1 Tax=Allacma fusca TaxID=39272 RepID=A0A8J2M5C6_9HEXA|nr:unnamed protein product [Allacma fusca]